MIELTGHLICKTEEDLALVRQILPEHIRLSRLEPGCLSFEVAQSPDTMVWTVSESFIDRAAFEAHQARGKASPWGRATAHLERRFTVTGL